MTGPHLILSGAIDYLAQGDNCSLRAFETRVEDAIGHVEPSRKAALINDIVDWLASNGAGEGVQVLLDYLDRQRHVVQGEL